MIKIYPILIILLSIVLSLKPQSKAPNPSQGWNYIINFKIKNKSEEKLCDRIIDKIRNSKTPEKVNIIINKEQVSKNKTGCLFIKQGEKITTNPKKKNKQKQNKSILDIYKFLEEHKSNKNALIVWEKMTCKPKCPCSIKIEPSNIFCLNPETKMLELNRAAICKYGIYFENPIRKFITNPKLKNELDKIYNKLGKKIDILGFDTGPASCIEICTEFKKYVKYIVAQEEIPPPIGWHHTQIIKHIKKGITPKKLVGKIVESFESKNKYHYSDYSISAVKLNQIFWLEKSIKKIITKIISHKENNLIVKKVLRKRLKKKGPGEISSIDYIDLKDLISSLKKNLKKFNKNRMMHFTGEIINQINQCIIERRCGRCKKKTCGLSIYFPQEKTNYITQYKKLNFSQITQWGVILDAISTKFPNKLKENIEK